ncbi:MAG: hypothetical protein NXI32_17195 [bacterium]|nr:hypothetical protein [bacterium]
MFCSTATKVERDQLSLLNVGDVLISGHPSNPMHSMVVVENDLMLGGQNCFIRGFNNRGTFGDQSPFLAYDAVDRNINDNAYWSKEGFGTAPSWNPLYVVSYLNFSLAVSTAAKYMFMR